MRCKGRLRALLFAAGILFSFPNASFGFGRNQLVTRGYPYKVWETEHFLIHYYDENPLLVEECAKYLEAAYLRVTKILDIAPKDKFPFFIYTTHNEFEENRIVDVGEGTGGVTEAFKDRLLIFNNGSMAWLKHVVFHEFAHEGQFAILNEGFWKSARLLKSILYPLWLMEGSAEYNAGEIDRTTDLMYARDGATSRTAGPLSVRDLHNFNHLKPNQVTRAYKQSARIVEYIADEYGEDKIGLLLRSFRERFDVSSVLLDVLGLDDERLDRNFREWYEETYGEPAKRLDEPSRYGVRITAPQEPIPVFHHSPIASPDGSRLITISIREGYPAVTETEIATGKRTLLTGREFRMVDWIGLDERNLAFSPEGRYIYFTGEKNQQELLYRYDRERRELESRRFPGLQALKSPRPDPLVPGGLVLAGMQNGFYDLYLVEFESGRILSRLTNDPQDDDSPWFFPDGSAVVYSSEVGITTEGYANRDLFLWRRQGGISERLTQGRRTEKTPTVSPDGRRIAFISDAGDAWDLYELDLDNSKVLRRTSVVGGIFSPSYLGHGSEMIFGSFRDAETHVYRAATDSLKADDVSGWFLPDEKRRAPNESMPETRLDFVGSYKTQFGTDLFLPAFFFSTQGGLFALAYWQGSDILGYHNISTNLVLNSGAGVLDYAADYSLSRWRTRLDFSFKGLQFRDPFVASDQGEDLRRKEHSQMVTASYPLDRFHRFEGGAGLLQRYDTFPSEFAALTNLQDFRLIGQFVRDTTTAPYLVVTRGSRFAAGLKRSLPAGGFDMDYLTKFIQWHQFYPVLANGSLASRIDFNESRGPNREIFALGGQGGVRGYPREPERDRKGGTLVHNLELRVPLFDDLNYHMWYMFPDFYFKNIYLGLFSDQGVRWQEGVSQAIREWPENRRKNLIHSVGLSLKFNTFILETFPFFFSLEWAKRTTSNGAILYGSVAQYFMFK